MRRTVLLLCGVMLSSLLPLPECFGAEPVEAYYPLQPGITWEYTVVSSKGGKRRITIKNLPAKELEGKQVTPREWNLGGKIKYYLVARNDFGIYRYGEQASPQAKPVVDTAKVYYLKDPVDRGTTWDITTKMGDRPLTANLTVESIDDVVTVPAGTFKNCVKIKHEGEAPPEKDKPGLLLTAYEWYAPGAGLVKSLVTIKEKSKEIRPVETMNYYLDSLKKP